jgi:pyruvate dehydrogenase E2 component (dihydrolipoamide acetyltransferase)
MRRYARTLGVTLESIAGSGPHGRITREDIEAFVKSRLAAAPAGTAKLVAQVTNFDKADITELEAFRQSLNAASGPAGARITLLSFAVKAAVSALKAYPKFNASLDCDSLISKHCWNIGVAVDTLDGLVVPVIKAADSKGLLEIAAEIGTLAAAARAGRLTPDDMQGATFTISSLGSISSTNFTPLINAPEVAILGMGRAELQLVRAGADIRDRLILPLSLSFDHRAVDGAAAARFLAQIANTLSDFRRAAL